MANDKIICDMPQGSILGPLHFFNIYVNELANIAVNSFALPFAHNASSYYKGRNIDSVGIIDEELDITH